MEPSRTLYLHNHISFCSCKIVNSISCYVVYDITKPSTSVLWNYKLGHAHFPSIKLSLNFIIFIYQIKEILFYVNNVVWESLIDYMLQSLQLCILLLLMLCTLIFGGMYIISLFWFFLLYCLC